jgi:ferredoxin
VAPPYADDHAGALLSVAPEAARGGKKPPHSRCRRCGYCWKSCYPCRRTAWKPSSSSWPGCSGAITALIWRIESGERSRAKSSGVVGVSAGGDGCAAPRQYGAPHHPASSHTLETARQSQETSKVRSIASNITFIETDHGGGVMDAIVSAEMAFSAPYLKQTIAFIIEDHCRADFSHHDSARVHSG